MISNKKSVQLIHKFCLDLNILDWVISPGSRNAPLTLTIGNDERFNAIPVVDERSAAFIALGQALKINRPVVISCTSGSASLNYAPAIAEAYYQEIPMLVVTADRPRKWIDNGEGQSIDQVNVYQNYCLKSFHLNEEDPENLILKTLNEIGECLLGVRRGPVHLNLAFEEPLYNTVEMESMEQVFFAPEKPINGIDPKIGEAFKTKSRIMILIGQMQRNDELEYLLSELICDTRIIVLTESNSNQNNFNFVNCIDRTLPHIDEKEFWPELVITLGGAIVSKRIKTYLRSIPGIEHWHISEGDVFPDVFEKLTRKISNKVTDVIRLLKQNLIVDPVNNFQVIWLQKSFQNQEKHFKFLEELEWSDLKAHSIIHDWLPDHGVLHQGNSSVVRYFQLFDPIKSVTYLSNRGVSGIDGCVSTAVGYASRDEGLNILVVGDLSFLYDSNAWWNKFDKSNLLVIVINNGGGNIFKIIEGPSSSGVLEGFFEVRSDVKISSIAQAHYIEYFKADNECKLDEVLNVLISRYNSSEFKGAIVEVDTRSKESDVILKNYFRSVNS
ncbi:MAG: 2-succinyl-5-enolpyruvyl-6-hydroxy-3-cyclohexene-1-carboxylic-acid synthase [Flavobacteriales bacterium]|nr:2-succinyl-5-enolpyruvyl-6-hydroxy-3-cyclohexene-1-carboxylic-acid synthase [Flavobacteriales bacterium]